MKHILEILITSAPLITVTMGALISEFAGVMAVFLDGIINFSAFSFYTATVFSGSPIIGFVIALLVSILFVLVSSYIIERFNANPFLIGLGINMMSSSVISMFSSIIFKSRGVLTNPAFSFSAIIVRPVTSLILWVIVIITTLLLFHSTWGIRTRITASDSELLSARGISPRFYRVMSWGVASVFACLTGCTLAMRLSSFVPDISSGRGWIALAAVFLGRKNGIGIIIAVLVFAAAEYVSTLLPGFQIMQDIPSSLFLALPYIVAFLLIVFVPKKKE